MHYAMMLAKREGAARQDIVRCCDETLAELKAVERRTFLTCCSSLLRQTVGESVSSFSAALVSRSGGRPSTASACTSLSLVERLAKVSQQKTAQSTTCVPSVSPHNRPSSCLQRDPPLSHDDPPRGHHHGPQSAPALLSSTTKRGTGRADSLRLLVRGTAEQQAAKALHECEKGLTLPTNKFRRGASQLVSACSNMAAPQQRKPVAVPKHPPAL